MEEKKKHIWLSIRQKMLTSYLVLVAIIVLTAVVSVWNIYRVYTNGSTIYSHYMKNVETIQSINQNLREIDRNLVLLTTEEDEENRASYAFTVLDLQAENDELLAEYGRLAANDTERQHYDACAAGVAALNRCADEILRRLESGDTAGALSVYETELSDAKSTVFSMMRSMAEASVQNAEEKNAENQHIFSQIIITAILIGVAAVIIAFMIALQMSNYFNRRLESIRKLAQRLAEYDISDDIEGMPADELGETMKALNDSQFKMRGLLERVVEEAAAMCEMGTDVSKAVRKAEERISTANIRIVQSFRMASGMDQTVSDMINSGQLGEPDTQKLREVLKLSDTAREMLTDSCGELSSITKFLEQIAVTVDCQNEMAASYQEQVGRFKLKPTTGTSAVQPADEKTE